MNILDKLSPAKRKKLDAILDRIVEVRREDLELDALMGICLRLSTHAYEDVEDSILPEGWVRVDHSDPNDLGLNASLYYNEDLDRYVCAFAGSVDLTDWKENMLQVGGESDQYALAVSFANRCVERCKENALSATRYAKDRLVFTGHSQGGGEAALAAFVHGCKAITFNPAGISDKTISHYNLKSTDHALVTAYIYWNDILFLSQMLVDMLSSAKVDPNGVIKLMVDKPLGYNPVKEWHGLDGFLKYMDIPYQPK